MKRDNVFKYFYKNFGLVIKVLIVQTVLLVAGVGLVMLVVSRFTSNVSGQLESSGLIEVLNNVLAELTSNKYSATEIVRLLGEMTLAFQRWGTQIDLFYYKLSLYAILFVLWIVLFKFLAGLGNVPLNMNLNERLSSSCRPPFYWQFFKNLKLSAKQQLLSIITELVADVFIFLATAGVFIVIFVYSGIWGMALTMVFFIACCAFRRTATAFWLPELTSSPKISVREAYRRGRKSIIDVFWKLYFKILLVYAITLTVVAGILLIFGIDFLSVLVCLIILSHNNVFASFIIMTHYYDVSGKQLYCLQHVI